MHKKLKTHLRRFENEKQALADAIREVQAECPHVEVFETPACWTPNETKLPASRLCVACGLEEVGTANSSYPLDHWESSLTKTTKLAASRLYGVLRRAEFDDCRLPVEASPASQDDERPRVASNG